MTTDGPTVKGRALVQELLARADKNVDRLTEELRQEQLLQRFLSVLEGHLALGHESEALRHVRAGSKALEVLRARNADLHTSVLTLADELASRVESGFAELVSRFPEAIEAAGLELDSDSRHPKYSLLGHLLEVQFDKGRLETRVTPRDGRRAVMGVDVIVVVDHVTSEVDRLTTRVVDPQQTLDRLISGYRSALTESGGQPGDSVPIKAIVSRLAKEKGFKADEFNVDLSRLVRDEQSVGRFKLENTRNPKEGILLWQLDQRGYYGYVKVEGEARN